MVSVKVVGSLLSWCAQFKTDASLKFAYNFMWNFFRKTVTSPTSDSEVLFNMNGLYLAMFGRMVQEDLATLQDSDSENLNS